MKSEELQEKMTNLTWQKIQRPKVAAKKTQQRTSTGKPSEERPIISARISRAIYEKIYQKFEDGAKTGKYRNFSEAVRDVVIEWDKLTVNASNN